MVGFGLTVSPLSCVSFETMSAPEPLMRTDLESVKQVELRTPYESSWRIEIVAC